MYSEHTAQTERIYTKICVALFLDKSRSNYLRKQRSTITFKKNWRTNSKNLPPLMTSPLACLEMWNDGEIYIYIYAKRK